MESASYKYPTKEGHKFSLSFSFSRKLGIESKNFPIDHQELFEVNGPLKKESFFCLRNLLLQLNANSNKRDSARGYYFMRWLDLYFLKIQNGI